MKKIVLACLLFLSVAPLAAQVAFGVRAGGAYSSLVQRRDGLLKSGGRFGYSVAGLMDMRIYHRVSFRPELVFINQGGSYYSALQSGDPEFHTCNYYSVQLPLHVVYTFTYEGVKFGVGGGPCLDIPLWGRTGGDGATRDLQFGTAAADRLKAFDLGIDVGINIEYNKFFFAVTSFCGLLNMNPHKQEGDPSLYQNNVTFSLGYMFRR